MQPLGGAGDFAAENIGAFKSVGNYPPVPLIPLAFGAGDDPRRGVQRESARNFCTMYRRH